MTDSVLNVVLGLVASAISAGLGWLAQTLRRRQRLGRTREFFGLPGGTECLLVINHHVASGIQRSVSRHDVYALMELSALVRECGAEAEMVPHDKVQVGLGHKTEFCLGGPSSNERSAAHLDWRLPGVRFEQETVDGFTSSTIRIGSQSYPYQRRDADHSGFAHVLLARLTVNPGARPVFLVCGQSATSNQAAVRYLSTHHRELARKFGRGGTFSLLLKVINPVSYGPDVVELLADVTEEAGTRRASQSAVIA